MKIIVPAVYVLSLGVLTFMQCRRLWNGREHREAVIYALCMLSSAVVGALLIAEVKVPTLVLPYKIVFEPIGKMILSK
jgi:hypothetical protein